MSKKFLKSAFTVSFMTLLSRILGQLRESVFAILFGATAGMDAFYVAFKIPNFMRRLFAEGSFSQAFVPILSEYKVKQTPAELKSLIQHVAGTLGLIVLCVSLLGMIFSGVWIALFAPGFIGEPYKFHTASILLKITFPYIFFISLTALAGGVLNCFNRFSIPAFTPVLLNIGMILSALYLRPFFQDAIVAAACGVFLGGLMQLLFQLPFLHKLQLLSWPAWGWKHPGVQRVIKLMLPALFGASVAQIGLLCDTLFASFLETGSVSWLNYADRLMQFPLGVFGVALSTVALPHLAKQYAAKDMVAFNSSLNFAFRLVFIIALPAAAALLLLSEPMTITLFQYRHFTPHDAHMSAMALMAFSMGLFFFIWVKVLVSAYYARQDTRTPVKIGIFAMVSNILFNLVLIKHFALVGLALSTGLASLINCGLLLWFLCWRKIYTPEAGFFVFCRNVILATLVMLLVLWQLNVPVAEWVHWGFFKRALHLSGIMGSGAAVYFAALWLCKVRFKDLMIRHATD